MLNIVFKFKKKMSFLGAKKSAVLALICYLCDMKVSLDNDE